jgi:hypothetical protein
MKRKARDISAGLPSLFAFQPCGVAEPMLVRGGFSPPKLRPVLGSGKFAQIDLADDIQRAVIFVSSCL